MSSRTPGSVPGAAELVDQLETVAGAVWSATRRLGYAPECCVAAVAATRRLVRRAGLTSSPVVVRALAANPVAAEQILAAVPLERWPAGAWSVGVDERDLDALEERMDPRVRARLQRHQRFHGHLVLEVRTPLGLWVVDAAAPQFARPEHRLDVDVVVAPLPATWPVDGVALLRNPRTGVLVRYERVPAPLQDYRSAADWRPERARSIVAVARQLLTTSAAPPADESD